MAKRKASNKRSPMLVPVESHDAIVEATGTNDPELAQRLINQVYETLWMPAKGFGYGNRDAQDRCGS